MWRLTRYYRLISGPMRRADPGLTRFLALPIAVRYFLLLGLCHLSNVKGPSIPVWEL
jgi:hypothetical protein